MLNDDSFDNVVKRKTYEINEMLSNEDQNITNIGWKIKNAINKVLDECENPNEDYSIFTDIERRSIEIDDERSKEHKLLMNKLKQFITYERKSRDEAQMWNSDNMNAYYPSNLCDHVSAYNVYKIEENLAKDKNIELSKDNIVREEIEKLNENSLSVINKYLRYTLIENLSN